MIICNRDNYDDPDLDHPWTILCIDNNSSVHLQTVARSLPGTSIFSNLYLFGIIRILGDVSRISFLLCSVVLVPTRHSFTIQQSKDSLLRYYFPTRVACVLLEVIRGATIRLPRVWGEVGYKVWEAMCLPFAGLPRITSLRTCTPAHLSEVCADVLNLFIGMINVPTRFTISFRSPKLPFSILLSHLRRHPLPQGRQVGVLKVKKGKRKASALQGLARGLRTFISPLFIRTPFVRKVLRAAGAPLLLTATLHNNAYRQS